MEQQLAKDVIPIREQTNVETAKKDIQTIAESKSIQKDPVLPQLLQMGENNIGYVW
jgi:hypothetical protein